MNAIENIRAALADVKRTWALRAQKEFRLACNTKAITEDRAKRDADHLAELRAYELTVSNLREQLAQQAPQIAQPDNLEQIIDDYVDDYAMEGDDGTYRPTESEKCLLKDAVMGLLADPAWNSAWGEIVEGSKQAPQVPMTEDEIVKCLVESSCIGKVMMSFESGPYDITRTSINADRLVRAVEAHHGIKEQPGQHPDDQAVDRFAVAMKAKLAVARANGRGGWDDPAQCTVDHLSNLLHSHVAKGDPVDVANFAMMLHQRGSGIKEQS